MSAHPPHLYRRASGTYYLRLTVPKPIRTQYAFSSRDIRLSLNTFNKAEACRLSCLLRYQFAHLLDSICNDRFTSADTNVAQLVTLKFKEIILRYYLKDKNHMTDERLDLPLPQDKVQDPTSSQSAVEVKPSEDATCLTTYIEKRPRRSTPSNKIIVDVNGTPVTFDHPDNPELEFEHAERLIARFGGSGGGMPPKDQVPFHSVRSVFDEYIEKKVRKNLKANVQTQNEHIQMLETCVKLLGPETNYYTLTDDDAEELKDRFLTLKDGRAKDPETAKTIGLSRAKRLLDRFKKLAKYAKKKKFNPEDIGDDLEILFNTEEKPDEDKVYSEDDLQKLYVGYPYTQLTLVRARELFDYHFWLIPVLMYTGARLNEICQLQVGDIKQEIPKKRKGSSEIPAPIHYVHIKNEYDDEGNKTQEVKTESSRRKVPLHKALIDLGFLDFVAKRKREVAASEQLFDGLYYSAKNKWGKKASDWFNGNGKMNSYREACNIDNFTAKNLHTFRHTFIGEMTDTIGVDGTLIPRFVGHETNRQTDKYGRKQVALARLKSEIDLLDYDIDLSHLNYDAFIAYKNRKGKG